MRAILLIALLAVLPGPLRAQLRPMEKDPAATRRVPASFGPFAVWIDPARWACAEDRPGRQLIRDLNGGAEVELLTDAAPLSTLAVKARLLDRFRKVDPRAAFTDSEARTVSGREVLVVRFEYTDNGVPYLVYGLIYGGPSGTAQFTRTGVKHLPFATLRELNRLLGGLEIRDEEPHK